MELKKNQKQHKLKKMNIQKTETTGIMNMIVGSKDEKPEADADELPRGHFYLEDIIHFTLEI
jgi:hypothetical protein